MAYQQISDFFDLRPAKDVTFDVTRSLSFFKESGASNPIPLIALDNQTILPFIIANGDANNIKTRAG